MQAPDIVNMGVHKDLPQALVLLSEMNVSAQHVASLVDDMIQKVRNGELSTDQGLSFLEMKYNMLLSYLINLTYVVLRKCSGGKIDGDPCIDRLVEIRTVLEKIRPIEHKLKYQIDKLVKTAVGGAANADDPTNFKPHPERLIAGEADSEEDESESDSEAEGAHSGKTAGAAKEGKYVPPKLSAVHYDEPNTKKSQERARKQQLSQAIMQDLREEYLDTPTEVAHASRAQQVLNKQQQERQRYEEEYMTRLPVTKAEKHQQRRQLTTLGTLGDEITDFGNAGGKANRKRKFKGAAGGKKGKRSFKRKRFH